MYHFRKLSGHYNIEVKTTHFDGLESKYSSQIQLSGRYQTADNNYLFELQSRQDVLLNGLPATQAADIFMLRLSDTYYPMKLQVSPNGEIMNVENYDEIIHRWQTEVSKIEEETPCIAYRQYIECIKPKIADKWNFLNTIKKDSFIQLYFTNYENDFIITCYNFPGNGDVSRYQFQKDNSALTDKAVYTATDNEYNGFIKCELSECMDLVSLDSEFIHMRETGQEVKSINIRVTDRQVKKANSVISFFTD